MDPPHFSRYRIYGAVYRFSGLSPHELEGENLAPRSRYGAALAPLASPSSDDTKICLYGGFKPHPA